ncbi:uncharacterized protein LOC125939804, partial [Dermacentor silvarum]|uniref:uncharacterized protein LOC125939804 n=1 Tax=Dermacentor silvarum TaxID=543639 RepID=UPI0021019A47
NSRGLHLSPTQSAAMAFTRKSMACYPVMIDGKIIPSVTHYKFLGVTIDRDLSWSKHISALRKKLDSFAQIIRHMSGKSWGPSQSSLLQLYQALFVGYLCYSAPVLSGISSSALRTLEGTQARALRICLGLPQCTSTWRTIAEACACPARVYLQHEPMRVHLRLLTRHRNHSLTNTSSAAAYTVPPKGITQRLKIGHKTSSTAAELTGIREAVRCVVRQNLANWTVFCDSKPALLTEASQSGHTIALQWIPSHCGIAGNEQVDAEAKMAHTDGKIIKLPFCRYDINALLHNSIKTSMERQWDNPEHRQERLYRLDAGLRFRLPLRMRRGQETLIHRLRLGVAYTRKYLHKIGRERDPACSVCHTPETIEHILCVCPQYATERRTLKRSVDCLNSRPFSEAKVLGGRIPRGTQQVAEVPVYKSRKH